MRTEDIKADTIDVAVERILVELGADTTSSRENAIYFDGWDGLGASAVFEAVAKRLAISNEPSTRPTGLEFEKIIHIDCSKWESRRAMQRQIAEQLKLPNRVMEMFDKQDEDDNFDGLDQGSRNEIAQVVREIYQATQNCRFLVILHNGSNEEIDIFKFGLYIYGYANSKMLWTFQGRFRLDPKMIDCVKKSTSTDVLLSASRDLRDQQELWFNLVRQEAAQVSCTKNGHRIIDQEIAVECVLYVLKRCCIGSHIVDFDWPVHTSNYWVCDGIIALTDIDKAWHVGNVLQREVRLLGIDNRHNTGESTIMSSSHLARSTEDMEYWISTSTCGFELSPSGVMPDDMFQPSHQLGVLKLSRCTFSFSLPPFLCCHSLRFLWLDHCQDLGTRTSNTDHYHTDAGKEKELDNTTTVLWECFQSLWVLDLRYTDWDQILSARMMDLMTQLRELNVMGANNWDMSHLRGRLRNIRKLRVTKSTCHFNNDVFSEMEMLVLLDFSGNSITRGMTSLSGAARNRSPQTVIIYENNGLEMISFRGCKELKNLFLKGYFSRVEELDISGTSVKTLDLREVKAGGLPGRIILLGCEKLRAILWPQHNEIQEWSGMLCIDTTSTTSPADGWGVPKVHPHADQSLEQQKEEKFKGWQISLTDARLLRSLYPTIYKYLPCCHIDICHASTLVGSKVQGASSDELVQVQPYSRTVVDSMYRDILKAGPAAAVTVWDCPKIPRPTRPLTWRSLETTCIIKVIMHGQGNKLLEDAESANTSDILLPDFICDGASSLHVYDNPAITSVPAPPQGSGWDKLTWCRVERCPKLHAVFTLPMVRQGTFSDDVSTGFQSLETFWASQLLTARYIWDWDWTTTATYIKHSGYFQSLVFLHLDYCPRLIHVLVMATHSVTLGALETLEIVHCGDLREVFPLGPELQEQDKITIFPKLRRIHLCELPKLQSICGRRMSCPNLKTIKITGCWSLRRLPSVGDNTKLPNVDCEKEWWDNLEWDGVENHHPSRYKSSHSLYYKSQLPRRSVLR